MRLKCGQGHLWESQEAAASPLVCPKCGGPPVDMHDTADDIKKVDAEQTLDLPATVGAALGATSGGAMLASHGSDSEMTQTFTPPPTPAPSRTPASTAGGKSSGGGKAAPTTSIAASGPMPFAIIRQHARGGLGVVNLARDVNIKREVALKQILPQHAGNNVLKRRFLYEAQITGQLEHPSIVPVYCLGTDESANPYYVMRFVKGRTLDEIIKEYHQSTNPIVFRELLRRFIAVCQAVAYAHSRGVIHRDLKPANVMLGDYGETLVLDWGLAKDIKQGGTDPAMWTDASTAGKATGVAASPGTLVAGAAAAGASRMSAGVGMDDAELTGHGQIIGTPAYMSPEQAEGRTDLHAAVTDIYALGGILYKILTGQSPQAPAASGTGTDGGHRRFTFVVSPPPSKVVPDVAPDLERICVRAMERDPAARYQRALEMAQDIQRWLDENPLTTKRNSGGLKLVLQTHAILIITLLLTVVFVLTTLLALKSRGAAH